MISIHWLLGSLTQSSTIRRHWTSEALELVYRLHAVNNVISTDQYYARVKAEFNALSTKVADMNPELIGAFGIPEELLSAPIARDWQ